MLQAVLEIQHFIHIQYTTVKLLSVAGHSDSPPPAKQTDFCTVRASVAAASKHVAAAKVI